jgi:DNA invertase Pin-like site-specific DNA recombinase
MMTALASLSAAIRAGMAKARLSGKQIGNFPKFNQEQARAIRALLSDGFSVLFVARVFKTTPRTIRRCRDGYPYINARACQ